MNRLFDFLADHKVFCVMVGHQWLDLDPLRGRVCFICGKVARNDQ